MVGKENYQERLRKTTESPPRFRSQNLVNETGKKVACCVKYSSIQKFISLNRIKRLVIECDAV